MTPVYLMDDYSDESKFQKWVADQIENDHSSYNSHDTHTYWLNGKQWKLTIIHLRELPLTDDISSIEKARKAEGIMDFGQGPNLEDGKTRVLFSIIRSRQLLMEPCPDKYENTGVWEMKCLHTMDERVPLEFGVTQSIDKKGLLLEQNSGDSEPVFLKVEAQYYTPSQFSSTRHSNVVSSGALLSSFLDLQLEQTNAFFCRCRGKVSLTHILIKLHETTRCIVPHREGYGIQEDTRSTTLKDCNFTNCCLDHSTFTSQGAAFIKYMALNEYNCNLPNVGPTFHSQNCSRTYALEIQLSFSCDSEYSCSLVFSLLMDIDVAFKDHNTDLKAPAQVQKRLEYLSVQVLKLSSNIMNDVAGIMAKQLQSMDSRCLGYHTCSIAKGEYALVITTIFLPDKLKKQIFDITWPRGKQVAFSDDEPRLVLSNGRWKFEGPIHENIDGLILSPFLAVSRASKLGCGICTSKYWLTCTRVPGGRAFPGEDLYNLIEVYVHGNTNFNKICFKRIRVDLIQHTTQRTVDGSQAQKKKSINLCKKRIKLWRSSHGKLDNTTGKFLRLDNALLNCRIPDVPPSLLSSSVHITYSVKIHILFFEWNPEMVKELTRFVELPINQKER